VERVFRLRYRTPQGQDAPQWNQRAAELRTVGAESPSDQAQVTRLSRANFFSAMTIAAELHCLTADG
jgi:hypothetical protein